MNGPIGFEARLRAELGGRQTYLDACGTAESCIRLLATLTNRHELTRFKTNRFIQSVLINSLKHKVKAVHPGLSLISEIARFFISRGDE